MRFISAVVLIAFTLTACGGGGETAVKDKPAVTKTQNPAFDKAAYADKLEAAYIAGNGRPIKDSCDAAFTNWQCYYDGIEAKSASWVTINMTTPGDISKSQAKAFSKKARTAYFNFVGPEFTKLDTIVTYVNEADTGTTYRRDVAMLNQ